MAKPWESPAHKSTGRHSLSVLHLPTKDAKRAEVISRQLSSEKGVHYVDVDLLRGKITLEFDPDVITLHEIRGRIAGHQG